ncbi:histidine kinase [Polaribacter reichenbachii]|uniref:Histidine kinase n=3 Tax=Polaribacter reichenbachii TaxID=996801 RepID=A0A1B8U081_9FLAO|nr:2TM domain-containing protein [Polaribacter reichenbachii]APZ47080.1 histidine kinase [Polaribacter reichenbachii]AUC17721.1 histidine kinase [Polaribacter reichenbachii]OBY65256.1 histidine kinase [Polaribacter reichenbachii]
MTTSNPTFFTKLKKDIFICIKLTVIMAVIFVIINQQFTLKGMGLVFLISAMYSFTLGLGNGLINDFLNTKWDWVTETNERVWAGIITTTIYTVIAVLIIHYVQYIVIFDNSFEDFFSGYLIWVHLFAIIFSLGVAAFFHARGFMINWKSAMTQETTKQEIVAKTETAKFESLKSQLDPHFLFNSLNVLTSLIGENPNQAEKFTTKLSKVYRYVLEQRNKDLVPILEELTFAKTYMQLLGMRFEDAVEFNIPDTVSNKDLKIVPLSLQLLLENAVKHNVVSSSKPLTINIYEENNYLIIENNINPKEAIGKSTKVGLQNIADRYGLITQRGVKIENNNKTFKVSLPLLYKMNDIMYTDDLENNKYVKAVERVEKLKEFYQNLASYCIVIPFLIFINLRFSPGFHWFWFPIFGWGMGLAFHFLEVNNYNIFLGRNWEDKKIKELMDKENNHKQYR